MGGLSRGGMAASGHGTGERQQHGNSACLRSRHGTQLAMANLMPENALRLFER